MRELKKVDGTFDKLIVNFVTVILGKIIKINTNVVKK